MIVREEQASDRTGVEALVEAAFRDLAVSDHTEHLLVARLRSAPTFIPELSLVAEECNRIVGHVLLTPVVIADGVGRTTALGVAPLSVAPDRWRRGIGSRLMREAHARAAALGFGSAVLVGHPDYYPRFGYRPASVFGIRFPFEAPDECCLAVELLPGGLCGVHGTVEYPSAFFG
ncbi:MAG TPA: N-acetyltransferase [Candidatus Alistipes avistercoris]|jgi:predicted N-acetyltransferase YhbS|uniref:GNAT family N-acetyltransferase n=1 Tax=uncultured Alistipes sp. TaxID=538949 RepID=UPI001F94E063|nr:N-acetyltransferase [uncultured Alistipes sp.]HIX97550.1 N-acetyltransferase [Candidatus Alistipes avistercoris]